MAALARASSDVIVEILSWLDIESVLQVGDASTSLRTTTSLDRVWAPRLATCGLTRIAVDARALAELSTIQVDARRLCLQCLPWRPRRGTGPDAASMWQSSWSWRPSQMPERLHQPTSSGDWIFVEIYETNDPGEVDDSINGRLPEHLRVSLPEVDEVNYFIRRLVAQKFVRAEDCTFDDFPNSVRVPLNLDPRVQNNDYRVHEIRVLMQLDGILVPLCDTTCMAGDDDLRSHETRQLTDVLEEDQPEGLNVDVNMEFTAAGISTRPDYFTVHWQSYKLDEGFNELPHDGRLGNGQQGLRDFHATTATRVITTIENPSSFYQYSFACDYKRDTLRPNFFDFRFKKPAG